MSQIASIKSFDQLLRYLEDELDWPIDDMDIDDLTFEYEPEELGLDPKNAAKFKSIKQLRPFDARQPFGIFFIEFEPKRLPVTALRRILARLVRNKRAGNERKRWAQDDLIFVSKYGDDGTRGISFAHFADDAENGLPTLRVLGWDADDTEPKIDWVENQLKGHLHWDEDLPTTEWRENWREAFVLRHRQVVNTSKKLAAELALLAQRIRATVIDAMSVESEKGSLHNTHKAFADSLIHDLTKDGFADMYAQTITYGLLSAGVSRFVPGEGVALLAEDAANLMPPTSPFLKELLDEFVRISGRQRNGSDLAGGGIDFDELGVNDVVQLLREADMNAVLRDFGRTRAGEDPVIHFYEDFMRDYDAQQRVKRGIYYTPKPVVSFIVRSVDEILREEFGLPLGLADTSTWGEMVAKNPDLNLPTFKVQKPDSPDEVDEPIDPNTPFVQILDPACGTGTFLVEVIDLIYNRMREHWLANDHMELQIDNLWNDYVADHLLPRLYGFELMMAPYAICHMKVGLKLAETGYRFRSSERLRVYLTNSLEPPHDLSEMLEFVAPFLAHEARAANVVKERLRPTTMVGNPPYTAMPSMIAGQIVDDIRTHYYPRDDIKEANPKLLLDDYVKFIRFAEATAALLPRCIVGLITNHGYLSGPVLRRMRTSLLGTFQQMILIDLHGNKNIGEVSPNGSPDENVFDIRQGVAISLLIRANRATHPLRRSDVFGSRAAKYALLSTRTGSDCDAHQIYPASPMFYLDSTDTSEQEEFNSGVSLTELFPLSSMGVKTNRDRLLVAMDDDRLTRRIERFAQSSESDRELGTEFGLEDGRYWDMARERKKIRAVDWRGRIVPFLYRPFDRRWIYYQQNLIEIGRGGAAYPVMRHLCGAPNVALIATRQTKDKWDCFVTDCTAGHKSCSAYDISYIFPLFELPPNAEEGSNGRSSVARVEPCSTISDAAASILVRSIKNTITPIQLFCFVYGQLFAPVYRDRYKPLLCREFPRLFPARNDSVFDAISVLGADLIALHLLKDEYAHASWNQPSATNHNPLAHPITKFHDEGDRQVRQVGEKGKTVAESPDFGEEFGRVYINDTAYFDGVPEEVWNFYIGGYQVCHKWLSDRKKKGGKNPRPGRILTDEDINHYHKIVIALNETIRLMNEIDEVIDAHGGWPDAFITDPDEIEKLKNQGEDDAT